MAKVTRKNLARGTKLNPTHTHGPLTDIATEVNASDVDLDQRQQRFAPFRVNLNIPYLDSTFISTVNEADAKYSIPFTLPPLQEDFAISTSAIGTKTPGVVPTYILDEMYISFDQRGEAGVIADFMHQGLVTGSITSASPQIADTFTINGIVFTCVNTGAVPADQEFDDVISSGSNIATANSIIATINHPTSQGLIAAVSSNDDGVFLIADDNNTAAVPVRASRGGDYMAARLISSNGARLPVVPLALANAENDSPEGGRVSFKDTNAYDMGFSLLEKTPTYFDSTIIRPEREVISTDMPALNFLGTRRNNPFVITDINQVIDPWKTYIAQLNVFNLRLRDEDDAISFLKTFALVNVVISLRFKAKMISRDTGDTIQNIPNHDGAKASRTVTVTVPAVGSEIEADSADGVGKSIATIDEVFRSKFDGGYSMDSDVPVSEDLAEESAYEIICVPIFSNNDEGGITSERVLTWPYAGTSTQDVDDRAFVRLAYPFVLHHVVLAYNWQTFAAPISTLGTSNAANSATFVAEVGVGMMEGFRSDNFDYDTIAFNQGDMVGPRSANWFTKEIDRIRTSERSVAQDAGGAILQWDVELHQIPLQGSGGTGYYAQGKPVFLGRGNWPDTSQRTNVGGGAPTTGGSEQFLEIRMRLSDTNGIDNVAAGGAQIDGSIVMGYQGCWVYLIGKKTLTDGR